eukprot:Opistho-1_new@52185
MRFGRVALATAVVLLCAAGMATADCESDIQSMPAPMIDASGKLPAGIIEGSWSDYGDYDECLFIPSAHFCMINGAAYAFTPGAVKPLAAQFQLGLCLPKSCSEEDVKTVFQLAAFMVKMRYNTTIGLTDDTLVGCN